MGTILGQSSFLGKRGNDILWDSLMQYTIKGECSGNFIVYGIAAGIYIYMYDISWEYDYGHDRLGMMGMGHGKTMGFIKFITFNSYNHKVYLII